MKETWKCEECGTVNDGKFCTNCGALKPEDVDVVETVEAEPVVTEAKSEPAPVVHVTEKKSHPFLTALLAGVVGLGAGFGGGYLAVKQFSPEPQVIYQETEPQASSTESTKEDAVIVENVSTGSSKSIQDVAETASRSVVEIQTENQVTTYGIFGGTYTSKSAGSGVIISEDGYIITNNHVVEGSSKISVTAYDGTEYEAQLIGTDSKSDIAVIKVDAKGLDAAVIGDSDNIRVGDTAIVIGNPLGTLGGTVTDGIISAINREMVINGQSMTLIQTNAAINNGNSGGGMFDADGKLIGIVNAKDSGMTSSGSVIEGLGFAIPINTAYDIASQLMDSGYVTDRATIGIGLSTLDQDYGMYKAGLYIAEVYAGGGAEEAGLQAYDRIISADGTEVNTYAELTKVLQNKKVGDTITLTIEREGEVSDYEVTLTGPLESMQNQ